ncbi:hypothetical protein BJ741DRAFT_588404 [Chytriomyces cf. hyalinus JEL632]|nr:hypothetical protein BJ741DRAFT_588404 [Chytriomyces cf. hyalinus JEL632]
MSAFSNIMIALYAFMLFSAARAGDTVVKGTSLTVTGTGMLSLPADCATIVVAIEADAPTALDAQRRASSVTSDVFAVLADLKATRVSTNSVSINAVYNYTATPAIITGFSAQTTISFQTTKDGAGPAVDATIAKGITTLQSITFSANPDKYASASKKASAAAVQDAVNQANNAALPLKLCVSSITSISLNAQPQNSGRPPMYFAKSASSDAGTTLQAGDISASASADVVVQLGTKCI